jgi:hypothetical protein
MAASERTRLALKLPTCGRCGEHPAGGAGCRAGVYFSRDGESFPAIPYTQESAPSPGCSACNAAGGFHHHAGCTAETCPRCGGRLVACDCDLRWAEVIS